MKQSTLIAYYNEYGYEIWDSVLGDSIYRRGNIFGDSFQITNNLKNAVPLEQIKRYAKYTLKEMVKFNRAKNGGVLYAQPERNT